MTRPAARRCPAATSPTIPYAPHGHEGTAAHLRRESLKRIDDDIDILKSYLKTEDAPKAAVEALEDLTIDQHKGWKAAMEKVRKALE
jgi:hypothetical protein